MILTALLYGCIEMLGVQQPRLSTDPHRRVVMRELVLAGRSDPDEETAWGPGHSLGDINQDARCEAFILGQTFNKRNMRDLLQANVFGGLGSRTQKLLSADYYFGQISTGSHRLLPSVALLPSPTGVRIASPRNLPGQEVGIWDLDTETLIGYVPFPPSPVPGASPIHFISGLFQAGDLDQDGYGDLFFVTWQDQGYAVTGMINGRTMTVDWLQYETLRFDDHGPVLHAEPSPPADLDGDLVPDFVASFGLYYGNQVNTAWTVARSGLTGGLIWRRETPGWGSAGAQATGVDGSGDGIADVFIHTGSTPLVSGQVSLLDGQSGGELWRRSVHLLDGRLPAYVSFYKFRGPTWLERSGGGVSSRVEACLFTSWFSATPRAEHDGVSYLDAATGQTLDYCDFPQQLLPWTSEEVYFWSSNCLLGDIDRDGYKEYGNPVQATLLDDPLNPLEGGHFAVFGRRTLVLPASVRAGDRVAASLRIPSAPGHSFYLILSESFDIHGGEHLDGWNTYFAPTSIYKASHQLRTISGVLDSAGDAKFSFKLPQLPITPGSKLYARAVILKPGTQDEVWTLSSVETLRYE